MTYSFLTETGHKHFVTGNTYMSQFSALEFYATGVWWTAFKYQEWHDFQSYVTDMFSEQTTKKHIYCA